MTAYDWNVIKKKILTLFPDKKRKISRKKMRKIVEASEDSVFKRELSKLLIQKTKEKQEFSDIRKYLEEINESEYNSMINYVFQTFLSLRSAEDVLFLYFARNLSNKEKIIPKMAIEFQNLFSKAHLELEDNVKELFSSYLSDQMQKRLSRYFDKQKNKNAENIINKITLFLKNINSTTTTFSDIILNGVVSYVESNIHFLKKNKEQVLELVQNFIQQPTPSTPPVEGEGLKTEDAQNKTTGNSALQKNFQEMLVMPAYAVSLVGKFVLYSSVKPQEPTRPEQVAVSKLHTSLNTVKTLLDADQNALHLDTLNLYSDIYTPATDTDTAEAQLGSPQTQTKKLDVQTDKIEEPNVKITNGVLYKNAILFWYVAVSSYNFFFETDSASKNEEQKTRLNFLLKKIQNKKEELNSRISGSDNTLLDIFKNQEQEINIPNNIKTTAMDDYVYKYAKQIVDTWCQEQFNNLLSLFTATSTERPEQFSRTEVNFDFILKPVTKKIYYNVSITEWLKELVKNVEKNIMEEIAKENNPNKKIIKQSLLYGIKVYVKSLERTYGVDGLYSWEFFNPQEIPVIRKHIYELNKDVSLKLRNQRTNTFTEEKLLVVANTAIKLALTLKNFVESKNKILNYQGGDNSSPYEILIKTKRLILISQILCRVGVPVSLEKNTLEHEKKLFSIYFYFVTHTLEEKFKKAISDQIEGALFGGKEVNNMIDKLVAQLENEKKELDKIVGSEEIKNSLKESYNDIIQRVIKLKEKNWYAIYKTKNIEKRINGYVLEKLREEFSTEDEQREKRGNVDKNKERIDIIRKAFGSELRESDPPFVNYTILADLGRRNFWQQLGFVLRSSAPKIRVISPLGTATKQVLGKLAKQNPQIYVKNVRKIEVIDAIVFRHSREIKGILKESNVMGWMDKKEYHLFEIKRFVSKLKFLNEDENIKKQEKDLGNVTDSPRPEMTPGTQSQPSISSTSVQQPMAPPAQTVAKQPTTPSVGGVSQQAAQPASPSTQPIKTQTPQAKQSSEGRPQDRQKQGSSNLYKNVFRDVNLDHEEITTARNSSKNEQGIIEQFSIDPYSTMCIGFYIPFGGTVFSLFEFFPETSMFLSRIANYFYKELIRGNHSPTSAMKIVQRHFSGEESISKFFAARSIAKTSFAHIKKELSRLSEPRAREGVEREKEIKRRSVSQEKLESLYMFPTSIPNPFLGMYVAIYFGISGEEQGLVSGSNEDNQVPYLDISSGHRNSKFNKTSYMGLSHWSGHNLTNIYVQVRLDVNPKIFDVQFGTSKQEGSFLKQFFYNPESIQAGGNSIKSIFLSLGNNVNFQDFGLEVFQKSSMSNVINGIISSFYLEDYVVGKERNETSLIKSVAISSQNIERADAGEGSREAAAVRRAEAEERAKLAGPPQQKKGPAPSPVPKEEEKKRVVPVRQLRQELDQKTNALMKNIGNPGATSAFGKTPKK